MTFKNKIYLAELTVISLITILLAISYNLIKMDYDRFIANTLHQEISFQREKVSHAFVSSKKVFESNKTTFKTIHEQALETYKKNLEKGKKTKAQLLQALKADIEKNYQLPNIEINLFLINKNHVVYESTLANDLGLDLSIFPTSVAIMKTAHTKKSVQVAEYISSDPTDLKLKLYSYAPVDNDNLLELSYTYAPLGEKTFTNKGNTIVSMKVFSILKGGTKGNYFYHPLNQQTNVNKQDFYENKVIFSEKNAKNDPIVQAFLTDTAIEKTENNILQHFTSLFDKSLVPTEYANIIAQFNVDLTRSTKFKEKLLVIFLMLGLIIIALIALFHWFLVTRIVIPRVISPLAKIEKNILRNEPVRLTKDLVNLHVEPVISHYNNLVKQLSETPDFSYLQNNTAPISKIAHVTAFNERISELKHNATQSKNQYSLLVIKITNFESILKLDNREDDNFFERFTSMLRKQVRGDEVVYQTDSAEFTFILEKTSLKDAQIVAKRVKNAILKTNKHLAFGESTSFIGALVTSNENDINNNDIINRARHIQASIRTHNVIKSEDGDEI